MFAYFLQLVVEGVRDREQSDEIVSINGQYTYENHLNETRIDSQYTRMSQFRAIANVLDSQKLVY